MKSVSLVRFFTRIACLLGLPLCLMATAWADVHVEDAWSLPLPPTSVNGAAYLTVHNRGSVADRLLEVVSDIAETAELHSHVMQDGQMSMMRLSGVDIPPNASVEFVPGGLHVMLLGLTKPFMRGEQYPLLLRFEHAGEVPAVVMIKERSAMSGHTGHSDSGGSGTD